MQKRSYHATRNNCYDYVIRFLNSINFENKSQHSKEDLVERLIKKEVELFESFHSLYKHIKENGIYLLDLTK